MKTIICIVLCLCLSGGLQAGTRKSNLKVLYVGVRRMSIMSVTVPIRRCWHKAVRNVWLPLTRC